MINITKIALLLSLWLVLSCRDSDTVNTVSPINNQITVEEAKTFINTQKQNGRLANKANATIRTEYWKDAQVTKFANDWPVVVVRLSYNYENRAVFRNGAPDKDKSSIRRTTNFSRSFLFIKIHKEKS